MTSRHLTPSFLVLAAAAVLALAAGLVYASGAEQSVSATLRQEERNAALLADLNAAMNREIQAGERYLNDPRPEHADRVQEMARAVREVQRDFASVNAPGTPAYPLVLVATQKLANAEVIYARAHRLTDLGRTDEARDAAAAAVTAVEELNAALADLAEVRSEEMLAAALDMQRQARSTAWIQLLLLAAVLTAAGAAYLHRRNHELQETRLREALTAADLRALRMQVDPHFLLNSLNSAAALVEADRPAEGTELLARLGDLFRARLRREEGSRIPLRDELQFIRSYLAVEGIRFGDRLQVEYEIEAELGRYLVPPWILQPLVENALRHGSNGDEPGFSRIRIRAQRFDEELHLTVEDNGPGFTEDASGDGLGLGLQNVRTRIALGYGSDGRVEVGQGALGGARVDVVLPLRDADPAAAGDAPISPYRPLRTLSRRRHRERS